MKVGHYQLFWEMYPWKLEMTFQTVIRTSFIETSYHYEENIESGKKE